MIVQSRQMAGFDGWWSDFTGRYFGSSEAEKARADLSRMVSALVALKEPIYHANIAKKEGVGNGADPKAEALFAQLRSQTAAILAQLCPKAQGQLKILMPAAVGVFGNSCVEIIEGSDGGFLEWKKRSNLKTLDEPGTGFGVAPLLIGAAVAVSAVIITINVSNVLSAVSKGADWLRAKESAKLAEQYIACSQTNTCSTLEMKAMIEAAASSPAQPSWFDKLMADTSKLVVGGLAVWAAVTWGPGLLEKLGKKK